MRKWFGVLVLALCLGVWGEDAETSSFDLAKAQPILKGSAWAGTPLSLEAVRGNAVVLLFWNADVAC